jgi:hypothetical protein
MRAVHEDGADRRRNHETATVADERSEMNCYECAKANDETVAVATCRYCSCGLCMEHLRIAASNPRRGGTHATCEHDTWLTRLPSPRRASHGAS